MLFQKGLKLQSLVEFWEYLPDDERLIVDYLRQIVLKTLPTAHKEKLSYNVPFYYCNRRICMIWPAAIPLGGIKKGVLFGFCYGNKLPDAHNYLTHGTNKQVYYKTFHTIEEINELTIVSLLKEAVAYDAKFKTRK